MFVRERVLAAFGVAAGHTLLTVRRSLHHTVHSTTLGQLTASVRGKIISSSLWRVAAFPWCLGDIYVAPLCLIHLRYIPEMLTRMGCF